MTLLIVSHVAHYLRDGHLLAYGPYAQEIELWADMFERVVIAAPLHGDLAPSDCLPIRVGNVTIAPQIEAGGNTLRAKLELAFRTPSMMFRLARAMSHADAIHVRCPGNLGLLGCVLAPRYAKRIVAKYAGQWGPSRRDAWSERLQKWILRSRWWNGPVTVYGEDSSSPNVVPFFTSVLTPDHISRAVTAVRNLRTHGPLRILYSGRLTVSKNVHILLEALAESTRRGEDMTCTIVGEGPMRADLESLSDELGIRERVTFTGGLPFERVLGHLETSDVLVLVSETEGWPKALVEGMAFGLVCVGSDCGIVPRLLDQRGCVVRPGDARGLAETLSRIYHHPNRYRNLRGNAAAWAQQFSIDGLQDALRTLLEERWNVKLLRSSRASGPRERNVWRMA